MCDDVKVPWERVFVHDDALLSRDIYIKTPSHCFGNHQSNVRYWSKMRLLLGLCSKIAQATGADQVPAVRETLGKMAAVEATIAGLVHGQINAFESWPRRATCASTAASCMPAWTGARRTTARFIDELRELCGGGVFQMPADISVLDDPRARQAVHHLLADAAGRRRHPHEAIQARLGHGRLRVRRPASAV